MSNEKKAAQGAVHSIVNNLHAAKDSMFGAPEMKFNISRMKQYSGMSEQSLIMRMMWFAYDNDPMFEPWRERLLNEWKALQTAE